MKSLLSVLAVLVFLTPNAFADEGFEKHVRPLLTDHCIKCHGPTKQAGGLRLDARESMLKGGDSGPAAVGGKPEESLLLKAVTYKGDLRMPPKGKLSDGEIAKLHDWVRRGAPWPASVEAPGASGPKGFVTDEHRRWWAYQPLRPVAPPRVQNEKWPQSEIDRFILAGLEGKGLSPATPAGKGTLLRRAAFDLIGLPPTPEEIDAFLKDDRPDAFARVVDRLLASPHYGERWGRHWLDAVRYTDLFVHPRDYSPAFSYELHEAYRYRDWVVAAFNRDLPYDQFVADQIAGDLIPGPKGELSRQDGLIATGFLCIGSVDHGDADKDKIVSDIVDDQIDTVGKAFIGLTLSCARCHDHKFDPISTEDYYGLAGIFYSTRVLESLGAKGAATVIKRVPFASASELAERQRRDQRASELVIRCEKALYRRLAMGGTVLVPTTFKSSAGYTADIGKDGIVELGGKNGGGSHTLEMEVPKGTVVKAIRLEALASPKLPVGGPGRAANGNFVVNKFEAQFAAVGGKAKSLPLVGAVADFEQPNHPAGSSLLGDPRTGWAVHPREGVDHAIVFKVGTDLPADGGTLSITITHLDATYGHSLGRFRLAVLPEMPQAEPGADLDWKKEADERDRLLPMIAAPLPLALAVQEGGTPGSLFPGVQDVQLHIRGSYTRLGPVVKRRMPQFFAGVAQPAVKGTGRLELARWVVGPDNPLTARVMVNRVWQHHIGEGIVRTPSNFGKLGEPPTHPELLDWLAVQFIQDGWSVKKLHRRIMLSAAYQQGGSVAKEIVAKDPDNRLLGRMAPRRLEAEAIRDAMLAASGKLDPTRGGPATPDLSVPRRSLYVATTRFDRTNFSTLFDAANPEQPVEKRGSSTVAPQALFLLNNPFVMTQAKDFAARLKLASKDDPARIRHGYELLYARQPSEDELRLGLRFIAAIGWDEYAHALLCANEFVYLD